MQKILIEEKAATFTKDKVLWWIGLALFLSMSLHNYTKVYYVNLSPTTTIYLKNAYTFSTLLSNILLKQEYSSLP